MADTDEPGGFHVPYPCWMLVRTDSIEHVEEGRSRLGDHPDWLIMSDTEGEKSVPVFTDDDLAYRFCSASGLMVGGTMISIDTGAELAACLATIGFEKNAKFVIFDPTQDTGPSRRVWPLIYAIPRIERGQAL